MIISLSRRRAYHFYLGFPSRVHISLKAGNKKNMPQADDKPTHIPHIRAKGKNGRYAVEAFKN